MAALEACSFGKKLGIECHKTSYSRKRALEIFSEIPTKEQELLLLRSGIDQIEQNGCICLHHKHYFLTKYEYFQKCCCDPFESHKSTIRKSLRTIDIESASFLQKNMGKILDQVRKFAAIVKLN